MFKVAKVFLTILTLSVIHSAPLLAQHSEEHSTQLEESHGENSHEKEEFNAGEFVIEHVSDAHDWHIVSFGDKDISIPLPVIIYSKNAELHEGKAFHIFMSSKFHHGHADYKGFRISQTEENKGKIVELDEHGQELEKLPTDLSITKTVAGIFVSAIVLLWLVLSVASSAKKNKDKAPRGLQNLFEPVILFIRDEVAIPAIGAKKYQKFMPFLLTLFFFILINNILGLIPIPPFGANVTGNIAVTMVLALFTFFITTINGNKHYWKEIVNPDVPLWLKFPLFPLMQVVEFSGMITKPIVLMVRLFANMLAGHMIVTVFVSLIFIFANLFGSAVGYAASPVSVLFSVFILLLDVLVSFIQAYVFTLLSALYFGMATEEHH